MKQISLLFTAYLAVNQLTQHSVLLSAAEFFFFLTTLMLNLFHSFPQGKLLLLLSSLFLLSCLSLSLIFNAFNALGSSLSVAVAAFLFGS